MAAAGPTRAQAPIVWTMQTVGGTVLLKGRRVTAGPAAMSVEGSSSQQLSLVLHCYIFCHTYSECLQFKPD